MWLSMIICAFILALGRPQIVIPPWFIKAHFLFLTVKVECHRFPITDKLIILAVCDRAHPREAPYCKCVSALCEDPFEAVQAVIEGPCLAL